MLDVGDLLILSMLGSKAFRALGDLGLFGLSRCRAFRGRAFRGLGLLGDFKV